MTETDWQARCECAEAALEAKDSALREEIAWKELARVGKLQSDFALDAQRQRAERAEAEAAALRERIGRLANALAQEVQESLDLRGSLGEARRQLEKRGEAVAEALGRYRGTEPLIAAVKSLAENFHNLEREAAALRADRDRLAAERQYLRVEVEVERNLRKESNQTVQTLAQERSRLAAEVTRLRRRLRANVQRAWGYHQEAAGNGAAADGWAHDAERLAAENVALQGNVDTLEQAHREDHDERLRLEERLKLAQEESGDAAWQRVAALEGLLERGAHIMGNLQRGDRDWVDEVQDALAAEPSAEALKEGGEPGAEPPQWLTDPENQPNQWGVDQAADREANRVD